jgi:hypothetical protein
MIQHNNLPSIYINVAPQQQQYTLNYVFSPLECYTMDYFIFGRFPSFARLRFDSFSLLDRLENRI